MPGLQIDGIQRSRAPLALILDENLHRRAPQAGSSFECVVDAAGNRQVQPERAWNRVLCRVGGAGFLSQTLGASAFRQVAFLPVGSAGSHALRSTAKSGAGQTHRGVDLGDMAKQDRRGQN